jgi:hypothetical protein
LNYISWSLRVLLGGGAGQALSFVSSQEGVSCGFRGFGGGFRRLGQLSSIISSR